MTGKYLISFCKKLFSYLLILIFYSYGSAHTYPFRRLRRHLSLKAKRLTHFYSVAPLLEKWFACFPTSGDSLYSSFSPFWQTGGEGFRFACFAFLLNCWKQPFYISHFFIFCFPYENYNSFFLSVSFPRIRREVPSLRDDRGMFAYTD